MKTGYVYFSVEPKGIIDLVRQMYWWEDRQQEAAEILACFSHITSEQIGAILEGNATITSDYHYFVQEDASFKETLKKHLGWKEKQFVTLASYKVPKDLLVEYGEHVVARLRDIVRRGGGVMPIELMLQVPELERIRSELHNKIINAVGLDRTHSDYWRFEDALSNWLDTVAGKFI